VHIKESSSLTDSQNCHPSIFTKQRETGRLQSSHGDYDRSFTHNNIIIYTYRKLTVWNTVATTMITPHTYTHTHTCNIASSPGSPIFFNAHATLKNGEWPGNEATHILQMESECFKHTRLSAANAYCHSMPKLRGKHK
jgi:hypothetical protein